MLNNLCCGSLPVELLIDHQCIDQLQVQEVQLSVQLPVQEAHHKGALWRIQWDHPEDKKLHRSMRKKITKRLMIILNTRNTSKKAGRILSKRACHHHEDHQVESHQVESHQAECTSHLILRVPPESVACMLLLPPERASWSQRVHLDSQKRNS